MFIVNLKDTADMTDSFGPFETAEEAAAWGRREFSPDGFTWWVSKLYTADTDSPPIPDSRWDHTALNEQIRGG